MKIILPIAAFLLFQFGFSQTIIGKWKTIDDITGKEKGIVEIYESHGKIFGKIIEIFESDHRNRRCDMCSGEDKNKPYLGLIIIKGMLKAGDVYEGGEILDPKIGKLYRCKMTLKGKEKLIVRGYIGIPLFGRTQTWIKI